MIKTCEVCGAEFVDRSRPQSARWCSPRCKREGKRKYDLQYREANREKKTANDKAYYDANREERKRKQRDYRAANLDTVRAKGRAYLKAQPEKARANWSKNYARRKGARIAPVDREAIYARDNNTCQLCGKKVNMKKRYPDPLSASLDHILPIARGGAHEPRNVQLVHLICNSRKKHTGIDQLRLFGE